MYWHERGCIKTIEEFICAQQGNITVGLSAQRQECSFWIKHAQFLKDFSNNFWLILRISVLEGKSNCTIFLDLVETVKLWFPRRFKERETISREYNSIAISELFINTFYFHLPCSTGDITTDLSVQSQQCNLWVKHALI